MQSMEQTNNHHMTGSSLIDKDILLKMFIFKKKVHWGHWYGEKNTFLDLPAINCIKRQAL